VTFHPGQRRRHARVRTKLDAPAFAAELAHPFLARVVDVSAGGVMLLADRRLDVGSALFLRLQAAEPPLDVTVAGVVVRECGEHIYGVSFRRLEQDAQFQVVRYVLCQLRVGGEVPAS
jgi:c-di-GMP-binding flagellar brake protein YcgR